MQSQRSRKRSLWRSKPVLSLGVAVGLLLTGELAARLYIFGWKAFDYRALEHFRTASKGGLYAASENPATLFEWVPNLETQSRLVDFRTNSRGMRDREYPPQKGSEVQRIATVGDSFTAGTGVQEYESWGALLEERLNDRKDLCRYEVWNWAVSGYHLSQYVATIESRVLATQPDLIIVGYCAQNDHEPLPDDVAYPYHVRPERNGFTAFYLHKLLKTWARRERHHLRREIPLDDESRPYLQRQFENLGRIARESGVPILVVFLNIYPLENSSIRRMVEEAGLEFVDAAQHFEYAKAGRYTFLPIDYHPNAAAHRVFCDVIEAALLQRQLIR